MIARGVSGFVESRIGGRVLSARTRRVVAHDLRRLVARTARRDASDIDPPVGLLHLGCGDRRLAGWLNVDLTGSDLDVDLGGGRLPWRSGAFEAVVSQHVIEHLELQSQALPLLREVRRVLKPGGELWLSCPDIEKICRSYVEHGLEDLLVDRQSRFPTFTLEGAPPSQLANHFFHQDGEHLNLFDWPLLRWALGESGFGEVHRVVETDLLARFPGFPERSDGAQTLYVKAVNALQRAGPGACAP